MAESAEQKQQTAGAADGASRLAWACLLGIVALVPLVVSNLTWTRLVSLPLTYDQFQLPKITLLCVLAGVGSLSLALAWMRGSLAPRVDRLWWILVAFLGWLVVATVLSVDRAVSAFGYYGRFGGLLLFVACALVFVLVTQLVDGPRRARSLLTAVCVGGGLVAAYGMMQRFGLDPVLWPRLPFEAGRPFSTIGNPVTLAGYLLFPLFIAPALAWTERRVGLRILYWAVCGLSATCLLATSTRGAWIGAVAGFVVLAMAVRRCRPAWSRVDLAALAAAGLVLLVVLAAAAPQLGARASSVLRSESWGSRVEMWRSAAAATAQRPLIGHGPDTFGVVFPRFETKRFVQLTRGTETADNAHSDPLELAATTGLIGLALAYGLFALILARSASASFRAGSGRILFAATWASLIAYLVYLLSGISVPAAAPIFWAALGLLASTRARPAALSPGAARAVVAAAAVVATALAVYAGVTLRADSLYLRSVTTADPGDAVSAARAATALQPFEITYREATADALKRLVIQETSRGGDQAGVSRLGMEAFQDAEGTLKTLVEKSPWYYPGVVRLAQLYDYGADFIDPRLRDSAISTAKTGLRDHPYGVDLLFELGIAYSANGKTAEAVSALRQAQAIQPGNRGVCLLLGQTLASGGRKAEAAEAYRAFLRVSPNDAVVSAALSSLGTK